MIASFDPAREKQRVAANADARRRALVARQSRFAQRATAGAVDASRNDLLFENLVEVDDLLRAKNFAAAEAQLQKLLSEYPSEPRIYFALGRAASLSAVGITDESALNERLTRALERYRMAVKLSAPDKDRALLSRAHEAMGRILTFQDKPEEAIKEFDAAIALKDVPGGAYLDAVAGKQKLAQPK
jgi:tetratricopeptide (TPR) repeat protein